MKTEQAWILLLFVLIIAIIILIGATADDRVVLKQLRVDFLTTCLEHNVSTRDCEDAFE